MESRFYPGERTKYPPTQGPRKGALPPASLLGGVGSKTLASSKTSTTIVVTNGSPELCVRHTDRCGSKINHQRTVHRGEN